MKKEAHFQSSTESTSSASDKDQAINILINALKERNVSQEQIDSLLAQGKTLIPISIFDNDALSALEAIVKYLKEERNLTFSDISRLLNRDARSIWTTYSNTRSKMKGALKTAPSEFSIPAEIIADRTLSVLETIVEHLKEQRQLSNTKIASLLRRNDKTIWTVYNRAKKKRGGAS